MTLVFKEWRKLHFGIELALATEGCVTDQLLSRKQ